MHNSHHARTRLFIYQRCGPLPSRCRLIPSKMVAVRPSSPLSYSPLSLCSQRPLVHSVLSMKSEAAYTERNRESAHLFTCRRRISCWQKQASVTVSCSMSCRDTIASPPCKVYVPFTRENGSQGQSPASQVIRPVPKASSHSEVPLQ